MTQRNARPPTDQVDEAGQEVSRSATTATLIVTRRLRDWRIRKFARRELDGLDPWVWSEPVGDVFADGRLDVPDRDRAGRELLNAGWCP